LVYGTQGQAERNIVERNTIINSSEGGIQVAADAIVRNNLIIGADHACIVSQPHQTATPSNLTIVHNTLVNSGDCLRTSSWGGQNIVFANNVLYTSNGSTIVGAGFGNATAIGNVTLTGLSAFVDLKLDGTARDATPAASSPMLGAGAAAHSVVKDLLGRIRTGPLDSGAVDGDQ
ncbi:MAG: right-handed parallel beta-helix repeat-containing protein, partial [Planctomycetota bacterium]